MLNINQPGSGGADSKHSYTSGLHHETTVRLWKFLLDSVVYVIPMYHLFGSTILSGVSIKNLS